VIVPTGQLVFSLEHKLGKYGLGDLLRKAREKGMKSERSVSKGK
jgi:hypothetical protein